MANMARQGYDISIAILGEGVTSRYLNRNDAEPELVEKLHSVSHKVAELIGANNILTYQLPDNRFDTLPLLDIVKIIEDLIRKLKPDIVYTHHGGDLNIDHSITHRAVLTATRPVSGCSVKELYTFEIPSSTEWSFFRNDTVFRPNVFTDINDTLTIKIAAMSLYESEMRSFPHPRSSEAIKAIAQRWGSVVGCAAAEAFELVRAIR